MNLTVHYIWIGTDVPSKYLSNFQKCASLNPNYNFQIWKTDDCVKLLKEHDLLEYWSTLSFICKCNLLKYLILNKFGGIYTDFDITWKVKFDKILYDFNFPGVDLLLTIIDNNPIRVDGQLVQLYDDPFIVSKPNILGSCINFCKNRKDLKYDGELYKTTKTLKTHTLEPIGPFGLTEWLFKHPTKINAFNQSVLLDHNGYFGIHEQKGAWR